MTQLFMGYKPGVGPTVKVLKYDTDDALTLANNAYDRYYFNSELQAISYTKDPWKTVINNANYPVVTNNDWVDYGGDVNSCSRSIGHQNAYFAFFAFPQKLFPGDFIPIAEHRYKNNQGRFVAAVRDRDFIAINSQQQHGIMTAYQFPNAHMVMSNFDYVRTPRGTVPTRFSGRAGEWVTSYGGRMDGAYGGIPVMPQWTNITSTTNDWVTVWWDLPADSSPIPNPSLPPQSGQENVRLSPAGFIVTRPGYTVDNSSGRQRIIDSTRNPPLCIMAGETPAFAPGTSTFVPAPPGISLSPDTVVEVMARIDGGALTVPALIITGYTPDFNVALSYSIASNGITFYNEGQANFVVRYAVFGVDFRAPSTGGSEIMRRANDGTRDYIQIKKPGTSDTNPLPNDILLDTRFPTLQIVSEGFLPLSAFTETVSGGDLRWGNVAATVNFANNGFYPFVKFTTVIPNCILPPMLAEIYHYPENSGSYNHRPTNQSAIAFVNDTSVKFFLSPGNPSAMTGINGSWSLTDVKYPDPLGIRYYIFAIPR